MQLERREILCTMSCRHGNRCFLILALMGLCRSNNLDLVSVAHAHLVFRIDMQSYTFKAGWKAIFVTFQEPDSLRKVLDVALSTKGITLGPEKKHYLANRMDPNRLAQYKPPCRFHEIGTFAAISRVDPTPKVNRSSSLTVDSSSPSSTVVSTPTASGAVVPGPSESSPMPRHHKAVPTAPQAMLRRSSYFAPPSTLHPGSASPTPRRSSIASVHELPPRPLSTNVSRTEGSNLESLRQKILSAQYDISEAETQLARSASRDQSVLPGSKGPVVVDESLLSSLESRAAEERSKRKALEREHDRLCRDLDEVDRAYERELERTDVAEAELRRVSRQARWRRTTTMKSSGDPGAGGDSMDIDRRGSIVGPDELDKLQKECDELRQNLTALDQELSLNDQICARLIRERDLLLEQESKLVMSQSQSQSIYQDSQDEEEAFESTKIEGPQPLIPLTPAMLNALITLDTIALSILQKIKIGQDDGGGPKFKAIASATATDEHAQQTEPLLHSSIGIKRRRSVSMD